MTEKKANKIKEDLLKLAAKHSLNDILLIFSYADDNDSELYSIGTASVIYKESVFYKQLQAVRRHLITGKFWEDLEKTD